MISMIVPEKAVAPLVMMVLEVICQGPPLTGENRQRKVRPVIPTEVAWK